MIQMEWEELKKFLKEDSGNVRMRGDGYKEGKSNQMSISHI